MKRLQKWSFTVLISIFLLTAAVGQQEMNTYISTGHARETYADKIGQNHFYIFPETRKDPIRWYDSLKVSWLENDPSGDPFTVDARPGEYLVYQVGVWALKNTLEDLEINLSDLIGNNGSTIASEQMTCFNKGGIDGKGLPFSKKVRVLQDRVQALWVGIDLANVSHGTYEGTVSIGAEGLAESIPIQLKVGGDMVPNHGFDEGSRLSRLAWLNNTVGIDSNITRGFERVQREGHHIEILGRSMDIAPTGLPAMLTSYFEPSNQFLQAEGEPLFKATFPFHHRVGKWRDHSFKAWKYSIYQTMVLPEFHGRSRSSSRECELICQGKMEYDGFADFKLTLNPKKTFSVKDIRTRNSDE